ncbi:Sm-like protein LSm1 [Daldinia childiae]|uniref:Sm-like protein LSm1 n=1 Tax=Daldinia childiae TaxID=326645 RepID=UPI001448A1AA|nr:Sm-like protein LSm1 [Daldinia childiae]KAF3071025.1 Sm-like protein LSm1 [Daldinia childiae]
MMENLSIHDPPPQPGGSSLGRAAAAASASTSSAAPQPQQLPPQMFTTAAQLLDLTDKKLLVCLRDGRKLNGVLRSWDQFGMNSLTNLILISISISITNIYIYVSANLVLQSTVERIYAITSDPSDPQPKGLYAEQTHGIFLVRGENVLLLGEIDLDKDDDPPPGFEKAEFAAVEKLAKERRAVEKTKEKKKLQKLATLGFEGENLGEVML